MTRPVATRDPRPSTFTAGYPRPAQLGLDGWAALSWTDVEIVGETPRRFRIRAITRTRLAGRYRWLNPGETAMVPKTAVRNIR